MYIPTMYGVTMARRHLKRLSVLIALQLTKFMFRLREEHSLVTLLTFSRRRIIMRLS